MRKVLLFILFLSHAFSFAEEKNWQGSAIRGDDISFKKEGFYAYSNVLDINKEYVIKSFADGKSVRIKVINVLKEPGLLVMLSPKAAEKIGIKGYLPIQVQVLEAGMKGFDVDEDIALESEDKNSEKKVSLVPAGFRSPKQEIDNSDYLSSIKESVDADKYYIQCASFSNLVSVYSAYEKYSKSYPIIVLKANVKGKSLYRFLVGPYDKKEMATDMLDTFKKLGFGQSYIRSGALLN